MTITPGAAVAAPALRWPLAATVDRVAGRVDPSLLSSASGARVRSLARQLPAAWTSQIYLESHLASGGERTDVVFAVRRDGAALIARDDHAAAIPPHLIDESAWRRVRELCRAWVDRQHPLGGMVDHIWLEFDLADDTARAVPGIFVSFGETRPSWFSSARWLAATVDALNVLRPASSSRARTALLARCFEQLPPGAFVHSVGLLFPRATGHVRVCVNGMSDAALVSYLAAIGWQGDVARLTALLERVRAARAGARSPGVGLVHVDVGESIGTRLGLEYYFDHRAQLAGRIPERRFLDFLVAEGLCEPAQRSGLERWPGYSSEQLRHELWPGLLVRRVNHVKLVCDAEQPPTAKAYLYFLHQRRLSRARGVGEVS